MVNFEYKCRHCLRYVYGPLIEKALDDFKRRWNAHTIRPNCVAGCPSGVPDDLYHLPQLTGIAMQCSYRLCHNYTFVVMVSTC